MVFDSARDHTEPRIYSAFAVILSEELNHKGKVELLLQLRNACEVLVCAEVGAAVGPEANRARLRKRTEPRCVEKMRKSLNNELSIVRQVVRDEVCDVSVNGLCNTRARVNINAEESAQRAAEVDVASLARLSAQANLLFEIENENELARKKIFDLNQLISTPGEK